MMNDRVAIAFTNVATATAYAVTVWDSTGAVLLGAIHFAPAVDANGIPHKIQYAYFTHPQAQQPAYQVEITARSGNVELGTFRDMLEANKCEGDIDPPPPPQPEPADFKACAFNQSANITPV